MQPIDDLSVGNLPYNLAKRSFNIEVTKKINEIIYVLNNKDTAIYSTDQFYTSAKWYVNKSPKEPDYMFRKVVSFGALPNNGAKSVAHELNDANPITANWRVFVIGGRAFAPTSGATLPIFYPSISIYTDYTNINITTTEDLSSFTTTEIILLFTQP